MYVQYTVVGFELTTYEYEYPPITTRPGLNIYHFVSKIIFILPP